MKATLFVAGALTAIAVAASATGQGRPITQADVEAAKALYEQMKPACTQGSNKKACGVLAYSPEDCNGKKKDAHVRKVYNTYEDGTVRAQQGQNGFIRQRPLALLAPIGIIQRDGTSIKYNSPQFVSWDEYQGGKKSVTVCGKSSRLEAGDFTLSVEIERFLKANP